MELRGNLMGSGRTQELLAVIDVQSDIHEIIPEVKHVESQQVRRRIIGKIRQRGSLWNDFMEFLSHSQPQIDPTDGKPYRGVQALFVDHDYYSPQWSLINVEGSTIRLLLIENFDGTTEEYAHELAARNKRIQDEIDKWESGDVTRNDLRAQMGLPPMAGPHFNERIPPEALAGALESFHKKPHFNYIT